MGLAVAGAVFFAPFDISQHAIERLAGVPLVEAPVSGQYDLRNEGEVLTATLGAIGIVLNGPVFDEVLFSPDLDTANEHGRRIAAATSARQFLVFCNYDSGGSYGFALFEGQAFARRRVIVAASRDIQDGAPIAIESRWSRTDLSPDERANYDPEEAPFYRDDVSGAIVTALQLPHVMTTSVVNELSGLDLFDFDGYDTHYRRA